jgi:hypothetical protein
LPHKFFIFFSELSNFFLENLRACLRDHHSFRLTPRGLSLTVRFHFLLLATWLPLVGPVRVFIVLELGVLSVLTLAVWPRKWTVERVASAFGGSFESDNSFRWGSHQLTCFDTDWVENVIRYFRSLVHVGNLPIFSTISDSRSSSSRTRSFTSFTSF